MAKFLKGKTSAVTYMALFLSIYTVVKPHASRITHSRENQLIT